MTSLEKCLKPAKNAASASPICFVSPDDLKKTLADLPAAARNWAKAQAFTAAAGQHITLPDSSGAIARVLCGVGTDPEKLDPFCYRRFVVQAAERHLLPEGLPG